MKMIDHNHFICHLILGTFTEYPQQSEKFMAYALSLSNRTEKRDHKER